MPITKLHIFLAGLGLIVVVALGVFVGVAGSKLIRQTVKQPAPTPEPPPEQAIISGYIQYNGLRPLPGNESIARVILYKRLLGEATYEQIPVSVPLVTAATWSWAEAVSGKTYEVQASVEFQGREISRSNTVVVTAPAGGEQLTFNVSEDQIPPDLLVMLNSQSTPTAQEEVMPTPTLGESQVIPGSEQVAASPSPSPFVDSGRSSPVAISGRVNLSGFVPPNARLQLRAAPEGSEAFDIVTTDIETKDNAVWIWSTAEAGKRYRIRLEMVDRDVILGKSEEVLVAAPATNQYLQLTSTAQPTTAQQQTQTGRAALVGKIDLNGPIANNSTILILQRKPGETSYTPVARVPAADGQTWSFDDAVSGHQYEMTAALQVNGNNTSSANAVTLTAPASNIIFRINTNVSLDAPGKPRLLTCGTKKSNGKWPAEVVFGQVQNASSYWVQVGTSAGGSDEHNEKRNRSKENEDKVILDLENNKQYFARFAQAQCENCSSDQDYSGFSETLSFTCSGQ
jgi:hypothetical protein